MGFIYKKYYMISVLLPSGLISIEILFQINHCIEKLKIKNTQKELYSKTNGKVTILGKHDGCGCLLIGSPKKLEGIIVIVADENSQIDIENGQDLEISMMSRDVKNESSNTFQEIWNNSTREMSGSHTKLAKKISNNLILNPKLISKV